MWSKTKKKKREDVEGQKEKRKERPSPQCELSNPWERNRKIKRKKGAMAHY